MYFKIQNSFKINRPNKQTKKRLKMKIEIEINKSIFKSVESPGTEKENVRFLQISGLPDRT